MKKGLLLFAAGMLTAAAGYGSASFYYDRLADAPPIHPSSQDAVDALLADADASLEESSGIHFADIAAESGIDFAYYDGAEGLYFLTETTGGGVGVIDYDNDGLRDLLFANGTRLPVDPSDRTHVSMLYRQEGPASFLNVTDPSRSGVVLYGQGVAVGDYNNDGFDDALLTGFGACILLHNNGDGTFEAAPLSGVQTELWGTSAALADLDRDGDLDIYLCTYAEVDVSNPFWCGTNDRRLHCHPQKYRPQPDLYFENLGDGRFEEASARTGFVDGGGRGLGLAVADFTGDGWPDVFVANDTSEAFLFVNENGSFHDAALEKGVALNGEGSMMAGMGVACADYDHNQWLDLYVSDYYEEKNPLFGNQGPLGFVDNTGPAGLEASSRDKLGWGTVFIDADLDGYDDLFVANGHVSDFGDRPYAMLQQFYRQVQHGRFEEVSASAGLYFQKPMHGRGAAWTDINNDGLPDVVVTHIRQQAALLLNSTTEHGRWIGLELVGTRSNRNGRNTRLQVQAGGQSRLFETVAGTGYLSSVDDRVLVGLGDAQRVEQIEIAWPSGRKQLVFPEEIDRYHRIVEPTSEE